MLTLNGKYEKVKVHRNPIVKAIKENEAGKSVQDICRGLGVSNVTFYTWKQHYGGMEVSDIKKMKELEEENSS